MKRHGWQIGLALVLIAVGAYVWSAAETGARDYKAGLAIADDPAAIADAQSRVKTGKALRIPMPVAGNIGEEQPSGNEDAGD